MNKKIYFLLLFFILSAFGLQAQFEISAELRPRFELNNGYANVPTDKTEPTYFVSQRSRINLKFNQEKYRMFFSLQDVRVWGADNIATSTGAYMNTGSTGIHQVWAEFDVFKNSRIRVGRQELKYDDQRLLAGRNWNQNGLTYDALLYSYQGENWQFDVALSYNNDASKGGSAGFGVNNFDVDPIGRRLRTVNSIYLKNQITEEFSLAMLNLLTGYQADKTSSTTYLMATQGFFGEYKKNAFTGKFNAYYQYGKTQSGKDVSAYMITAEVDYKARKLNVGIGIDYLSGQDASNPDADYQSKFHAFDLLYGGRSARYGNMNQYVVPSSTQNGGLIDIYPKLAYHFTPKSTLSATYHIFSLATAIDEPGGNLTILEGSLGGELDLIYAHKFSKEIVLSAGVSVYNTNDTFAKMKSISTAKIETPIWGWMMLTFKPTLFSSK
ncbi:MAG: alginate export family protein [Bacteroidales bacterium]|nr:alginate export family protein [Bacteroidales bacterium]